MRTIGAVGFGKWLRGNGLGRLEREVGYGRGCATVRAGDAAGLEPLFWRGDQAGGKKPASWPSGERGGRVMTGSVGATGHSWDARLYPGIGFGQG